MQGCGGVGFLDSGYGQGMIALLSGNGIAGEVIGRDDLLLRQQSGGYQIVLLIGQCITSGFHEEVKYCRAALLPEAELVVIGILEKDQILAAFAAGADDCIDQVAPLAEIIARVAARQRARRRLAPPCDGKCGRGDPRDVQGPSLSAPPREGDKLAESCRELSSEADLDLSLSTRALHGPRGVAPLTRTESRFMHFLTSAHEAVSAEQLAVAILGRRDCVGRGRDLVYRHLANLRKKMRAVGLSVGLLQCTPYGYRFDTAYSVLHATSAI